MNSAEKKIVDEALEDIRLHCDEIENEDCDLQEGIELIEGALSRLKELNKK